MTPEATLLETWNLVYPLSLIAYCLSGYLLSAHNKLKREVGELRAKLEAVEEAATRPSL